MDAFDMSEIVEGHRENGELYHEFLRAERISVGLYVLAAGATDPQVPHTEDEIYYIVSGAATIEVDGENRPASAGSVIYPGQAIAVPTLVVRGEHEYEAIMSSCDELVRRIDGARLVVIPGAGHKLPIEQPEALTEAVVRFLAEIAE